MNDNKHKLQEYNEQKRANAIIDREMGVEAHSDVRADGYTNMLNKYGTSQDNSTAYRYQPESLTTDMELLHLYEGNGLFAKIIDRPSEEAIKHGLDIDYDDEETKDYVDRRLDYLDFEDKFTTAEKWARLYGGAIIVMLCDDGGALEEPLDWKKVKSIEELRVFERSVVQEDETSYYQFNFEETLSAKRVYNEPEWYHVFSMYGYFTVHRSRCLVFRNGRMPEQTTNSTYRYWGMPEYVRIKQALEETVVTHHNAVLLLERSVQAIYKMKNLANMLSTDEGEDKVLQRLQVIDMARGLLNSIAIDNDGEDYDFRTTTMAGVKDVIDSTCNMLSAVTNIPQTILFGRSPAGENSTGESDFENYYNMVENIQKINFKKNVRTLIDLILVQGKLEHKIKEIPEYKVKFTPLWSLSDQEQAQVDSTKAATEKTKCDTAVAYVNAGVLDPSEVRRKLSQTDEFDIDEIIEEEDYLKMPKIEPPEQPQEPQTQENEENTSEDINNTPKKPKVTGVANGDSRYDGDDSNRAAAVLVIKDGKVLVAKRTDNNQYCGPGGHRHEGEDLRDAALREAQEEFNIVPLNIKPLGYVRAEGDCNTMVYICNEYSGDVEADEYEMSNAEWIPINKLDELDLFPPFENSIGLLQKVLHLDGGAGSGNFNHAGRPGQRGGSASSIHSENMAGLISDDSYYFKPEVKALRQKTGELARKQSEASHKWNELYSKSKTAGTPKPKGQWNEEDEWNSLIGIRPKTYTEEEKKILSDTDKAFKEMQSAAKEWSESADKMEAIREEEHKKQISEWERPRLVPAEQTSYQGFSLTKGSNGMHQEWLDKGQGWVVEMSPKEYLQRCAYDIFTDATFETAVAGLSTKDIEKYAEQMKNGTEFDMPYLDYSGRQQEGRHRAVAAYLNGYDKIPVFVHGKTNQ